MGIFCYNAHMNARPNLIEFYGEDCPHCERVRELTLKLEKEFGVTFIRLEVWNNIKNEIKMQEYSRGGCDGVPYLYNEESGIGICGEVSYKKIKAWAGIK